MNLISKKILEGTVRHIVGMASAALVAKGVMDESTANQLTPILTGTALGAATFIWSWFDKKSLVIDERPQELVLEREQTPTIEQPAAGYPKGFKLGKRSLDNLTGVHPELVKVIKQAIIASPYDFTVIDGLRTQSEQRALYYGNPRRTWTLTKSKHLKQDDGTSHAVDLAILTGGYLHTNRAELSAINDHIQDIAAEYGLDIRWGGNWQKTPDCYHWEIHL